MTRNDQPKLWYEDVWDALRDTVRAAGGPKAVGARLRPELPPHKAGEWLSNCLNPAHAQKLDIDQFLLILSIGREHSCHVAMHFMARESGYTEPQTREPEDETAQLMRDYLAGVKSLGKIAERLERLSPALRPAG